MKKWIARIWLALLVAISIGAIIYGYIFVPAMREAVINVGAAGIVVAISLWAIANLDD